VDCEVFAMLVRVVPRARARKSNVFALASTKRLKVTGGDREDTRFSFRTVLAVGAVGAISGILIGQEDSRLRGLTRPSGTFRTCCSVQPSAKHLELPKNLEDIVGRSNVSCNVKQIGSRLGKGVALAVVRPGTLEEAVRVLEACVAADVAVIPQGANSGLTGGSVPRDECDRPTVVINMRRLSKILPIGDTANQVLCFGGAGIYDLQQILKNDFNRDSHSVLGSLFLNPSVGAGVAFGSGGTQIQKGPAFTDRALFCKVRQDGKVEIVNKLGLKDDRDVFKFLESRDKLSVDDLDPSCRACASWPNYKERVTSIDGEVSRANADTAGIECNRSEGKVLILATVHDTWPMPSSSKLLWVACEDVETAIEVKKVCIASPQCMAKQCEYLNRNIFDCIDRAGRILILMIDLIGMQRLEPLWNLKLFIESVPLPFTDIICDKLLYWFNPILPTSMPRVLTELGRKYDHHVLIELADYSEGDVETLQKNLDDLSASRPGKVMCHVCEEGKERTRATLFRFVAAPAFRTFVIGRGLQGLSIDYAMPKNRTTFPVLPECAPLEPNGRLIYSHFACNVFHEDLVFGLEVDVPKAKKAIKHAIEEEGGRLPAEHGHGTEYVAPPKTQQRWMEMDPLNVMNPGVGGLSHFKDYSSIPVHLHGRQSQ